MQLSHAAEQALLDELFGARPPPARGGAVEAPPLTMTVEIADAKGELHDYRALLAVGPGGPAARVHRLDTGSRYAVTRLGPGEWHCDCPAFRFRKDRKTVCKHVRRLMDMEVE